MQWKHGICVTMQPDDAVAPACRTQSTVDAVLQWASSPIAAAAAADWNPRCRYGRRFVFGDLNWHAADCSLPSRHSPQHDVSVFGTPGFAWQMLCGEPANHHKFSNALESRILATSCCSGVQKCGQTQSGHYSTSGRVAPKSSFIRTGSFSICFWYIAPGLARVASSCRCHECIHQCPPF